MGTIDASKMTKKVYDASGKLLSSQEPREDAKVGEAVNFHWYKKDADGKYSADIAQQIASTIKFMTRHQGTRIEQLTASTRLYGNSSAFNLIGTGFTRANSVNSNPQSQRISYNLCSSVGDTLTAKIAKLKVLPTFITNGGDWEVQQRAQDLSKFVEGVFYETKMHEKGTYAFRDGYAWGNGIVFIDELRNKIYAERVFPHELVVDLIETLSSDPTQMHRVKIVDRSVLLGMYPDCEEQIMAASPANFDDIGGLGTAADLVTFTSSWHLSGNPDADEDATDGCYAVCVGDQPLEVRPYLKNYFPFVMTTYCKRLLGFWGQGGCERLQNLQGEINRLMILVQRSMWMGGSFKVLVKIGSKVVSQHLNNDVGSIIHWAGDVPPQYITPPMIQQDIYPYIDALITKGYNQEGVSMLDASSVKPLGVDSGKALRTMVDIADDRQEFLQQDMENFYLECSRQMIEKAKEIAKRKKSYKVMFPSTNFAQTIDWKDVELDSDKYVMKAFPASSLSDDFTGRLQDVQELMQAGIISPRAGRKLLRRPDLEMADALSSAAEDLLCQKIENCLKKEEAAVAEPTMDLVLGKQLCLEYINYAQYHGCPEERVQLVRDFLNSINDKLGVNVPPPLPRWAHPRRCPRRLPYRNLFQTFRRPLAPD